MPGCHIYRTKDFIGWCGVGLYLYYGRTVFCSRKSFGEYGCSTCWTAIITSAKTYYPMLSPIVGQCKVSQVDFSFWFAISRALVFVVYLLCRACDALRSCLPDMLRDATFSSCLRVSTHSASNTFRMVLVFQITYGYDLTWGSENFFQEDPTTRRWLQQLLHNVGVSRVSALQAGGGGFDHIMWM